MRFINPLLRSPYALILPALILCVAFSIIPAIMAVRNSFFNVDYVTRTDAFVGAKNYLSIFRDGDFLQVMGNTVIFTVFTIIFAIPLAVLAAVFLNRNTFVHNFTQSVVFTPHIISFVSVATLWMFLMDPQFGLLNWIVGLFGIKPLQWMLSPDTSLMSIIIVNVWKTLGYNVLIVISALQGIPAEVYEAARMDRSGRVKTFFHITLPMISPTFVFLVTTSIIQTFSTFDLVKLMTGGGPKNSSNLMVYWIYKTGFLNFQIGRAMAGAVVLLVFVGTISVLNFTFMNKKAHYQ
jgi:sn-glycerol 3-phosphate transport system permease protein